MKDGSWRNSSSLDFGVPKSKKLCWFICPYCDNVMQINIRTVGILCNECKRYCSISDEKRLTSLQFIDAQFLHTHDSPHVPNRELLKFRNGMEERAYIFKDKQDAKRKAGEARVYHGPIDPETGEHTK